jgi:hypothetical protein
MKEKYCPQCGRELINDVFVYSFHIDSLMRVDFCSPTCLEKYFNIEKKPLNYPVWSDDMFKNKTLKRIAKQAKQKMDEKVK